MNIRFIREIYDLLKRDSDAAGVSIPVYVNRILKDYYKNEL